MRILVLAFVLCSLLASAAAPPTFDFAALDAVIEGELKARGTPGAAVAIISGGAVVYSKGFGVRSSESREAVTPETVFRLGSTTKMMTAAAVVTLAARGKVGLERPIGNAISGLDATLARVTPHDLLRQAAGLRDFPSPVTSDDDDALGRNVRGWKGDVFFTEPGEVFSYSSAGYWTAGLVAETAHGKPYADAMQELLFTPLGMGRTTLRPLTAATWPLALPHDTQAAKASVVRPLPNNAAMWPGGSVYSTVTDVSRFVIALMDGGRLDGAQALDPLVAEKLLAPQVRLPGDGGVSYGYGTMQYDMRGVRVVTHGGVSRGYGSTIQMVPAKKFAIVVLMNRNGETLPATRNRAMEIAIPNAPAETEPAKVALASEELRRCAGVY